MTHGGLLMLGDYRERPVGAEELTAAESPAFPSLLSYLPEGANVSIALNKPTRTQGEEAYRAYLGHTYQCTKCVQGAPCADAARLNRVWKATR